MRPKIILASAVSLCVASWWLVAEDAETSPNRAALTKLFEAGQFQDCYEGARRRALDPKTDPNQVADDLSLAVVSLQQLGRIDEIEEVVESSVTRHLSHWRLLYRAAQIYGTSIEHSGFVIAGKFQRGPNRGGGQYVSSDARDRVRALQLMRQAVPLATKEANKADVAKFCSEFAQQIGSVQAWRLQTLTDLTVLPDYEDRNPWSGRGRGGISDGGGSKGAPVDAEGNPIFHQRPKSWEAAVSDGERWRWMLTQTVEFDNTLRNEVDFTLATFLHQQFGVQTMAWLRGGSGSDDDKNESGPFAVQTLGDDETIAKLASGVKRIKLPDEFNALKLFQQIFERAKDHHSKSASDAVAQTFEDRRQYVKAGNAWKAALAKFGNEDHRRARLDQIVKNWGRFENLQVAPAGKGATVDFRFRNAKQVSFEAHAIKIDKLLDDVKAYLKSSPAQLDWQQFNVQDVGYKLVTEGNVKYKVLRTAHDSHWHPTARWDWFYGRGYWWFASDYTWYPGFNRWGCFRPVAWWIGHNPGPPEVIAEQEVELGPEGEVSVVIDTLPAKEVHGDEDHSYSITAEVVDESRRTIVGTGSVLVARQPFRVFAWVNRGHCKVGDTVLANFDAHTIDNKPVKGTGELTLFKVTYNAKQQPVEEAVQTWKLNTDEAGHAQQQLAASKAGQYRLSYKVTDAKDHTIEGGYVFVVRGDGFDGREFRFNDLELITDKQEYAPGETVKLMVTTNKPDGCVVLFVRPSNGVYLPPKVIRLKGKNTVEDVVVVQKDMPNFFLEAFTIADGKYHQEAREVVVPPEKRVINVEVLPSQTEYKPGADAKVQIKLTDHTGEPFIGSTVLSVYDKSVEYISGGSNVPEIKEFFWKWRRHHHPARDCTLDRVFSNLLKNGEIGMADLGVFGGMLGEEMAGFDGRMGGGGPMPMTRGRAGGMNRRMMAATAAPGGPPAAMAAAMEGAPMADAAPMAKEGMAADKAGGGAGAGAMQQPTIRSNFADTAFWAGAITTDKSGLVEVSFKMPESLTGWKVKTWAMGLGTKVGQGETEVTTKKNLLVRLQAPRFFVDKDEVVISANVHSYLKTAKQVDVSLLLDGALLSVLAPAAKGGDAAGPQEITQTIKLAAGAEQRVDWRVKVASQGSTSITVKALSDEESDAMQMSFPVYVHGMLKTESFSGAIRPADASGKVTFDVPEARRPNESRLEARFTPTLAGAMVDALPYMVDYPYGCTEQTLNRFLPTVITQRVLLDMQLNLKDIQAKRTNLNAQEIGDDVERAKRWKRFDRNPVFDEDEVRTMVKDGLERLTSMQCSDGGWGWFSGYGEHSWPHTTAVVVHGLQVAKANDVAIVPGVLEKGIEWLQRYQDEQVQWIKNWGKKDVRQKQFADALDALVYMILVDADVSNGEMNEFLYRDRVQLPVYAKALYGLALHKQQQADKLKMILENIEQFVVQDDENQTAYLKLPDGGWWYWYGSDIEANAYYLKLLSKTNPQDARASRLVKYILNNRKHATYWNSTRDTALCIEALADYMKASGEDKPNLTVEVVKPVHVRQQVRAGGRCRYDRQAHAGIEEAGNRPALLQRLPDQLHARRLHHQGGAGGEGKPQILQADPRGQGRRCPRLARSGRQAKGRKVRKDGASQPEPTQERRPRRNRTGDRQQERLRVPDV